MTVATPTVAGTAPEPDELRARPLLSDAARSILRRAVLDGTLRPGEQLCDADLIEWLGVSRTPIRSALDDLRDAGLVELSANRWTRVALPSTAEVALDAEVWSGLLVALLRRAAPSGGDRSALVAALLRRGADLVSVRAGTPLEIAELGTVAAVPLVLARHAGHEPMGEAFAEVSARLALGLAARGCGVPAPAWTAYASALAVALDEADAAATSAATVGLLDAVLATAS